MKILDNLVDDTIKKTVPPTEIFWSAPDCVLKELYTSETTLAQKIVLTPLNNEFKLKIWNSTSFMLKSPPKFLKKIYKNQCLASWRGLIRVANSKFSVKTTSPEF